MVEVVGGAHCIVGCEGNVGETKVSPDIGNRSTRIVGEPARSVVRNRRIRNAQAGEIRNRCCDSNPRISVGRNRRIGDHHIGDRCGTVKRHTRPLVTRRNNIRERQVGDWR